LASLRERFPGAFSEVRPLAIGIDRAIIAVTPEIRPWEAKAALAIHCRTKRYRNGLLEGAVRVDLDGKPRGVVTAAEAAQAKVETPKAGKDLRPNGPKPAKPAEPARPPARPIIGLGGAWKRAAT